MVLSYSLREIGIVWLIDVILGLACSMSCLLVTYAKKRKKEEINSLILVYFALKTSKGRNKINKIEINQTIRARALNSPGNISSNMN